MIKTIFFILVVYFLVRTVSRLFLSGPKKKNSNFRFFYQTYKNVRDQQKNQQNQQQQERTANGQVKKNDLDNIEEAEYEDVTEDNSDK